MLPFREVFYVKKIEKSKTCFLVGDIGGTNSNFGVIEPHNNSFVLLMSLHFKSKEITDIAAVIQDLLTYLNTKYSLTISKACLGAAGVVSEYRDWVKPTNLTFEIDAKKIKELSGLAQVILINDFEAVGFGIGELPKKDVVHINNGNPRVYANKAIIGAGTGLGKGVMAWDEPRHTYIPVPSEGGHADCAVQDQQDLKFITFIRESEKIACNISWEHILSGEGIRRIYRFLGTTNSYQPTQYTHELESNGLHPDKVFEFRRHDARCNDTFELFSHWYGRCAKNFALDVLALGGVYIAGGIAAKNRELFTIPQFMAEFINCGKQMKLLQQVPVYVVLDYNVSLYGAARYLSLRKSAA